MLHGVNIVPNFFSIGGIMNLVGLRFEEEQLIEPGNRPFDPARQYSLSTDEWADEQMGIRQPSADSRQFFKCLIGVRYSFH